MKPITLLALLLAVKLGAAEATAPLPSLPSSISVSSTFTLSSGIWGKNDANGNVVLHVPREPIVTRTADGWSITFREPEKPALAPNQRLAPDGVNVITKQADGSETSTLVHVVPTPATTASTSRP